MHSSPVLTGAQVPHPWLKSTESVCVKNTDPVFSSCESCPVSFPVSDSLISSIASPAPAITTHTYTIVQKICINQNFLHHSKIYVCAPSNPITLHYIDCLVSIKGSWSCFTILFTEDKCLTEFCRYCRVMPGILQVLSGNAGFKKQQVISNQTSLNSVFNLPDFCFNFVVCTKFHGMHEWNCLNI